GAHQQEQLAARILGVQTLERIDRVAEAATIDFAGVDLEGFVAANRELEHFDAIDGWGKRLILLVGRNRGRGEPDRVEAALHAATLGQEEVAVVNRIEAAAEEAEAHEGK